MMILTEDKGAALQVLVVCPSHTGGAVGGNEQRSLLENLSSKHERLMLRAS